MTALATALSVIALGAMAHVVRAQSPVIALSDLHRAGLRSASQVSVSPHLPHVIAPLAHLELQAKLCRRSGLRVTGQFFAGLASAWVGGLVAWGAKDDATGPDRQIKGDAGYTPAANTAYALGSWFGSAAAVYLAGTRRRECGSLIRTVGFTVLPTLPLFLGRDEPYLPVVGVVLIAPLQAGVATGAYSRRRRE